MRKTASLLLLLILTAASFAEVKIQGDAKVKLHNFVELSASGAVPGTAFLWRVYGPDGKRISDAKQVKASKESLNFVGPAGVYRVELLSAFYDEKTKQQSFSEDLFTVTIGDGKPEPGPRPGPTPDPDNPAPIPLAGLRMLIIEESAERNKLPPAQASILFSTEIRKYLNGKCPAGSDGKTKEWRIWDYDSDTSAEEKHWQAAMNRKPGKDKLPWVIISNGKTGYEGPLPATVAETITLLKKYGGE